MTSRSMFLIGLAIAAILAIFSIMSVRSAHQREQQAKEENANLERLEKERKQAADQREQDEQRLREQEAKQLRKDFPKLHLRHLEETRHNLTAVKQQMDEGKTQEQAESNVHQANGMCFPAPVVEITVDTLQRHDQEVEMCRKVREENSRAWKK